jgi:3-methyladenine DNA glycosylase AlkC
MASLLKELYSPTFYKGIAKVLSQAIPGFDKKKFISGIFTAGFEEMELKQRMRHTTIILHGFMPEEFPLAAKILCRLPGLLTKEGYKGGLEFIFLPDYIEMYGLEDFERSVSAFETITKFITCEFAVRPFLKKYEGRMLRQMLIWSKSKDASVRRLASEGTRPRLPWAMAVPALKKDPSSILPILENLKNDPSESVRRSVANNLNDIGRDHPEIVSRIAGEWKGVSKETDRLVRHACRGLLKQGHSATLELYGLSSGKLEVSKARISTPVVNWGEEVRFDFVVKNVDEKDQTMRLEYALYLLRGRGKYSKKVFRISERKLPQQEQVKVTAKQSFRPITTRRYYPGWQELAIVVNGAEKWRGRFLLKEE